MLTLPILVAGIDPSGEEFLEETHTVVVNRDGALIFLRHLLAPENTIRIFNLQNDAAGDFRVVGPTRLAVDEGTEWGVEYVKEGMNIWGVEFPRRGADDQTGGSALLECQTCQKKFFWPLTFMEVEVLTSTGTIQNTCDKCHAITSWAHANIRFRPAQFTPPSRLPTPLPTKEEEEKREDRRVLIRLPVLVRDGQGEAETSQTENVSPGNLAVALSLKLAVGDVVTVICPYTVTGKNTEREGTVMRRESFALGAKRLYGIRYALPGAVTTGKRPAEK